MANKITLKKSSVLIGDEPKAPTLSDLAYGELAINYAAGRLYFKKADNTIAYFSTPIPETDTLSSVTGRGASTSTAVSLNGGLSTNIIKQSYTTATYSGSPATYSMDTNTAGSWYITLQANIILSFTNIASNIGSSGYVFLKQDATGGRTFTLSSEIKTPGGRTFTQTTTANSLSMITYFVADASSVVINYIADFK